MKSEMQILRFFLVEQTSYNMHQHGATCMEQPVFVGKMLKVESSINTTNP